MFRIGILGSDNSHALMFAKLCNIPDENGEYLYDDVRVTAIYGFDDDPEHTKKVADEGGIEFIAHSPENFYGTVDAVMVVYRQGSLHVPHILPFIEKGYPVWIDKPIAESITDINILRESVEKNNALITGGSNIKYNYEILTLKNKISNGSLGDVNGGYMNFPADLMSEYGGIFFYGSHLCEMCLSVFGYDVKSVYAVSAEPTNTIVTVRYTDKLVALNFNGKTSKYFMTVHGAKNSVTLELDISVIYRLGFDQFVWMLRTKRMPLTFANLVTPVYMLHAIKKSLNEGVEVEMGEICR